MTVSKPEEVIKDKVVVMLRKVGWDGEESALHGEIKENPITPMILLGGKIRRSLGIQTKAIVFVKVKDSVGKYCPTAVDQQFKLFLGGATVNRLLSTFLGNPALGTDLEIKRKVDNSEIISYDKEIVIENLRHFGCDPENMN